MMMGMGRPMSHNPIPRMVNLLISVQHGHNALYFKRLLQPGGLKGR